MQLGTRINQLIVFLSVTISFPLFALTNDVVSAIQIGDAARVEILLHTNPANNINAPVNKTGESLLHIAVSTHYKMTDDNLKKIIQLLVQKKIDVNIKDNNGYTALAHYIAQSRNPHQAKTKLILDQFIQYKADVNAVTHDGQSLLHLAAVSNNTYALQRLVAEGISINIRNQQGLTPLHIAVKGPLELVKTCIDLGADIELKDNIGRSALHNAIDYNKPQTADHLLRSGADIESKDRDNHTPLSRAVETKQWALVKHLILKGANVDVSTGDGWSVGKFLLFHKELDMSDLVAERGITSGIIAEADIHLINKSIEERDISTLSAMIDNNVVIKPEQENDKLLFETLIYAYSSRHPLYPLATAQQIAKALNRLGADVNKVNKTSNSTPLISSLILRRVEVVNLLITSGADVNKPIKDLAGRVRYPLDFALELPDTPVLNALLNAGASANLQSLHTWSAIHRLTKSLAHATPDSVMTTETQELIRRVLKDTHTVIDFTSNRDAEELFKIKVEMNNSRSPFDRAIASQLSFSGTPASLKRMLRGAKVSSHASQTQAGDTSKIKRIGKSYSKNSKVHVVGVYEGFVPGGSLPWWSKCKKDQTGKIDPRDAQDCHQKYAGQKTEGMVTVTVGPSKMPIILVLMAYNPTNWKISLQGGTKIEGVILAGYHGQRASGLGKGIYIEAHTYEHSECGNCQQHDDHFYAYSQSKDPDDFRRSMKKIVEITDHYPNSFQGKYKGKAFNIAMH